jgi:hypothetical protein
VNPALAGNLSLKEFMGSALPPIAPIRSGVPAKALVFAVAALLTLLLPAHAAADPALDGVATAAESAEPAISAAASAAEPAVEAAAPAAETVLDAAQPAVVEATPVIEAAADTSAPAVEAIVEPARPVKLAIAPAVEPVVAQVQPAVEAAAQAVEPVVETAAPLIDPIADTALATLPPLASLLMPPGMGFAPPAEPAAAIADSPAMPAHDTQGAAPPGAAQSGAGQAAWIPVARNHAGYPSLLALLTEPAATSPAPTPSARSTEIAPTGADQPSVSLLGVRLPFGISSPGSLAPGTSTATFLMLVLVASAALALPALGRRVRLLPGTLRPPGFVSLLERPG